MQTKGENQGGRSGVWYYPAVQFPLDLPPAGRAFDAAAFGLNTTDLLAVVPNHPAPGEKVPITELVSLPGGQAATAMTAVSRLGWSARYIGRFGDDANGQGGRIRLEQDGVDVSACETRANATNALSLVLVDEQTGQRTVLWSRHPDLAYQPDDVPRDAVQSARVLLVDSHDTAAATMAAQLARSEGVPTVVDIEHVRPGTEALLREIDVIVTAQEFPEALTGQAGIGRALRTLQDSFQAPVVCTTLGEDGSLALVGTTEIRTPGFAVDVVDTTGAGDVFRGGFIAAWLLGGRSARVEDVLRYANAVAALKCRALGAREGIPTRDEVSALLRGEPCNPSPHGLV